MELRQLKYFVSVAEALHYGNAAKKLSVSQPALSQQIQLLENEIGVELFVRIKRTHLRKVELTEAGQGFLVEAKKILQLSQRAIDNARRIGRQQKMIHLGVYKTLLRDGIVEIMKLFSVHFPELEIKIIELPTFLDIQDALLDETIDLGLTLSPLERPGLFAKTIKKGHLLIIMPQNHPLATEPALSLASLKNEKWIEISKPFNPVFDDIEHYCQQVGFSRIPHLVQEVSSLELLCSLVGLGMGIAFVPSLMNLTHVQGIVVKNIINEDHTPFIAIEINQSIAFKTEKLSPLKMALASLIDEK